MALMMSVSGVRGIIGESMTPSLATELASAFGTVLGGGKVVIGRDSRPSGAMIQQAVVAGLQAVGCDVVMIDIASTPATGLMVRTLKAAGGIVITASHNPVIWNGIKFLTAEGLAPPPEQAERIFEVYRNKTFALADVNHLGLADSDTSADEKHVASALQLVDPAQIVAHKFHVALDSVNGAGGPEGRMLLKRLGCDIVHINEQPDGQFAHTPEPLAENLTELSKLVGDRKLQVGFAQDPDADRLAIVDETGRYIGEEYTLALAAKYMFSAHPGPAAANLSTSRMIDDLADQAGDPCRVFRSAVGEANVVSTMKAHGCTFGGEGNGGIINLRVGPIRDSLVAMALVLQLLADTGKTISQLVDEIPAYVMLKRKADCSQEKIQTVLEKVKQKYRNEKINDIDGVRIDFEDGWVHVRGSNTEPIIRIIAEAPTSDRAEQLVGDIEQLMGA